jgi:hypothetical protein
MSVHRNAGIHRHPQPLLQLIDLPLLIEQHLLQLFDLRRPIRVTLPHRQRQRESQHRRQSLDHPKLLNLWFF